MSRGRLTDDAVREIRATIEARRRLPTDGELATRYGISERTVRAVGNRDLYRSVDDDDSLPALLQPQAG